MMKINIITMHRIINYGSVLQAYGLKCELESHQGVKCRFVDYKPEQNFYKNYMIQVIRPLVLTAKNLFITSDERRLFITRRNLSFLVKFQKKLLGTSCIPNYNLNADVTVIGSDEVFNVCQNSLWKKSMYYFGEKVKFGRLYSYAASFGNTTIQLLEKERLSCILRRNLNRFDVISVRDNNSEYIVHTLYEGKIKRHLDPVLIYPFLKEVCEPIQKDYIIIYSYDDRMCEETMISKIKEFAKKYKKKLISIGGYQDWCDVNIAPEPFEVLGYFKNSDYIVTDTFHGAVFSIKYQKKFVAIIRSQNNEKLLDLLYFFNLKDRSVNDTYSSIEQILLKDYDYQAVKTKIDIERKFARDYLNEICGTSQ